MNTTRLKIIKQTDSSSGGGGSSSSGNGTPTSNAVDDPEGLPAPSNSGDSEFVALINPATLTFGASINYNGPSPNASPAGAGASSSASPAQPIGQAHPHLIYQSTDPETLSFKLVFDGTGALGAATNQPGFVTQQINQLKKITYYYQGEAHEPNKVLIAWGNFTFYAKLRSMSINYKLFNPEGDPVRAEVDLQFSGSTNPEEAQRLMNQSSPDLSHVRVIKAGDTLPLMCKRIYGNSKMYLEVARINGLVNFRNLKPGTEILFPPIKK